MTITITITTTTTTIIIIAIYIILKRIYLMHSHNSVAHAQTRIYIV